MIRCVRLFSGPDGNSHFEDGFIDMPLSQRGDILSGVTDVKTVSFRETGIGGEFEWHNDPTPQYVITLSGVLEFEMKGGEKFTINPGDILLATDTTGTGHRWRILDGNSWRRMYVVLKDGQASIGFKSGK